MPIVKVVFIIALLLALPASSITLREPTTDEGGRPLTSLSACAYWIDDNSLPYWVPVSSPNGGGLHLLPAPTKFPTIYTAACINDAGWSKKATMIVDDLPKAPFILQ